MKSVWIDFNVDHPLLIDFRSQAPSLELTQNKISKFNFEGYVNLHINKQGYVSVINSAQSGKYMKKFLNSVLNTANRDNLFSEIFPLHYHITVICKMSTADSIKCFEIKAEDVWGNQRNTNLSSPSEKSLLVNKTLYTLRLSKGHIRSKRVQA